jgi:hypothetical protein
MSEKLEQNRVGGEWCGFANNLLAVAGEAQQSVQM